MPKYPLPPGEHYRPYTPPKGYMTLPMACKKLRMGRNKLRVLMLKQGIPEYSDPKDSRQVLVKASDVDKLLSPDVVTLRERPASLLAQVS